MKKRLITRDLFDWFSSGFTFQTQLMVLFTVLMTTVTVSTCLVISNEINASSQHQGDSIGQVLSAQTASAATDMLVTGDRLSISVLLNQLVHNPYVAEAGIYSIDNQLIAQATSKTARADVTFPVYSSPIHYQDVIAGYVRISLNQALLSQKPKEALSVIVALGLIVLLVGLLLWYFYASGVTVRLRLIERQLTGIFPKANTPSPQLVGEIARISAFVEQRLLDKNLAEPEQEVIDQEETAVIAVIKVKNLARLQQLLAPWELQDILRVHSEIIRESASCYDAEVTYTPEGNAYLRFASTREDGLLYTTASVFCCLMIETLTEQAGAVSVARAHIGIGLSVSDNQTDFPEEQHPALGDSAASQALTLANLPDGDGIYVYRVQADWFPADVLDFAIVDEEITKIAGAREEHTGQLRQHINRVTRYLHLSDNTSDKDLID